MSPKFTSLAPIFPEIQTHIFSYLTQMLNRYLGCNMAKTRIIMYCCPTCVMPKAASQGG